MASRLTYLIAFLISCLCVTSAFGQDSKEATPGKKSADEIAKELANPAGSLASLNFNLQYTEFTGDLRGADDQETRP